MRVETRNEIVDISMQMFDLFSHWIFVWYLLYLVGVPYNPKFALTIGLIENGIVLFTLIYYKNKWVNIALFCTVNFFIKVVPLWTLRHTPYTKQQILATIILYMVYSIYLAMNGKNVISIYKKSFIAAQNGTYVGPMSVVVKKMWETTLPRPTYHTNINSSSTAR